MRAAVLTAFNEPLTVHEILERPLGPTDVRVRVDASGICGSDISNYKGLRQPPLPVIQGHECAGTVLEVGGDVHHLRSGDRVIASPQGVCGSCWYCVRDKTNLCAHGGDGRNQIRAELEDGTEVGRFYGLGTFSEVLTTDQFRLVKVETDLPAEQLALIGCGVTTGVGAVLNTARVEAGSTVAIIGCGGVGQSAIQGARIAGASRIFAIDPVEMKRAYSAELGATDLIDPTTTDVVEAIREATGGRGVDYTIEALGRTAQLREGFHMTRPGGTLVMVGMPGNDDVISFGGMELWNGERTIKSSMFGSSQIRRDFQRYIDLAESGQLDIGRMISRTIDLTEVNDAYRAMQAGEVVRLVITQ